MGDNNINPEIENIINIISNDFRLKIYNTFLDIYKKQVDNFQLKFPDGCDYKSYYKNKLYNSDVRQFLIMKLGIYRLKDDYQDLITEFAYEISAQKIEPFKSKMISKLSDIMGSYQNLKFEYHGDMNYHSVYFQSESGPKFEIRNKIVHNYNGISGCHYIQYPTTFHNVIDKDGNKIELPNEQKIKNILK